MKPSRHVKQVRKGPIVGVQMQPLLLKMVDDEASAEGTSRSHIIRRRLLESYRKDLAPNAPRNGKRAANS